jgi:hypothetical protein
MSVYMSCITRLEAEIGSSGMYPYICITSIFLHLYICLYMCIYMSRITRLEAEMVKEMDSSGIYMYICIYVYTTLYGYVYI